MDKHFSLPKDGGLLIDKLPAGILHADDKIYTDVFPEQSEASELISEMVISSIKEF